MQRDPLPLQRYATIGLLAVIAGVGAFAIGNRRAPDPAPISFVDKQALAQPAGQSQLETSAAPNQTVRPEAKEVVIHATGAVKVHGLLHMPADSRVDDAIKKAGGAVADADLDNINLAAKLVDGSQLAVPHKGKPEEVALIAEPYKPGTNTAYLTSPSPSSSASTGSSATKSAPSGPVSLNTGTMAQLDSLPGVGPSTAQKIIEYRQEHGGFSSVDELMAVKGIGPKKMKSMRKYLKL